mmetsp:Transcript_10827/g.19236  ORF Transcript_10827/g.19236 Transcript_10827/m.19236 type:complete len:1016 (+) Transcript_10827:94-3141(+)
MAHSKKPKKRSSTVPVGPQEQTWSWPGRRHSEPNLLAGETQSLARSNINLMHQSIDSKMLRGVYHHAREHLQSTESSAASSQQGRLKRAAGAVRYAARAVLMSNNVVHRWLDALNSHEEVDERQEEPSEAENRDHLVDDMTGTILPKLDKLLSDIDEDGGLKSQAVELISHLQDSEESLRRLSAAYVVDLEEFNELSELLDSSAAEAIRRVSVLNGAVFELQKSLNRAFHIPEQTIAEEEEDDDDDECSSDEEVATLENEHENESDKLLSAFAADSQGEGASPGADKAGQRTGSDGTTTTTKGPPSPIVKGSRSRSRASTWGSMNGSYESAEMPRASRRRWKFLSQVLCSTPVKLAEDLINDVKQQHLAMGMPELPSLFQAKESAKAEEEKEEEEAAEASEEDKPRRPQLKSKNIQMSLFSSMVESFGSSVSPLPPELGARRHTFAVGSRSSMRPRLAGQQRSSLPTQLLPRNDLEPLASVAESSRKVAFGLGDHNVVQKEVISKASASQLRSGTRVLFQDDETPPDLSTPEAALPERDGTSPEGTVTVPASTSLRRGNQAKSGAGSPARHGQGKADESFPRSEQGKANSGATSLRDDMGESMEEPEELSGAREPERATSAFLKSLGFGFNSAPSLHAVSEPGTATASFLESLRVQTEGEESCDKLHGLSGTQATTARWLRSVSRATDAETDLAEKLPGAVDRPATAQRVHRLKSRPSAAHPGGGSIDGELLIGWTLRSNSSASSSQPIRPRSGQRIHSHRLKIRPLSASSSATSASGEQELENMSLADLSGPALKRRPSSAKKRPMSGMSASSAYSAASSADCDVSDRESSEVGHTIGFSRLDEIGAMPLSRLSSGNGCDLRLHHSYPRVDPKEVLSVSPGEGLVEKALLKRHRLWTLGLAESSLEPTPERPITRRSGRAKADATLNNSSWLSYFAETPVVSRILSTGRKAETKPGLSRVASAPGKRSFRPMSAVTSEDLDLPVVGGRLYRRKVSKDAKFKARNPRGSSPPRRR